MSLLGVDGGIFFVAAGAQSLTRKICLVSSPGELPTRTSLSTTAFSAPSSGRCVLLLRKM